MPGVLAIALLSLVAALVIRFAGVLVFRPLTAAMAELPAVAVPRLPSIAPLGRLGAAIGPPTSAVFELLAMASFPLPPAMRFWLLTVADRRLLRDTRGNAFLHSRFLANARSVALSPINGERPNQPGSPSPRLSWSYSWKLNGRDTVQRTSISLSVPPIAWQLAQTPW